MTTMPQSTSHVTTSRTEELTEREAEVMDRVSLGLSNAEIAAALFVCESTIKSHLIAVNRKLGAHNRTLAAVLYDRQKRGA